MNIFKILSVDSVYSFVSRASNHTKPAAPAAIQETVAITKKAHQYGIPTPEPIDIEALMKTTYQGPKLMTKGTKEALERAAQTHTNKPIADQTLLVKVPLGKRTRKLLEETKTYLRHAVSVNILRKVEEYSEALSKGIKQEAVDRISKKENLGMNRVKEMRRSLEASIESLRSSKPNLSQMEVSKPFPNFNIAEKARAEYLRAIVVTLSKIKQAGGQSLAILNVNFKKSLASSEVTSRKIRNETKRILVNKMAETRALIAEKKALLAQKGALLGEKIALLAEKRALLTLFRKKTEELANNIFVDKNLARTSKSLENLVISAKPKLAQLSMRSSDLAVSCDLKYFELEAKHIAESAEQSREVKDLKQLKDLEMMKNLDLMKSLDFMQDLKLTKDPILGMQAVLGSETPSIALDPGLLATMQISSSIGGVLASKRIKKSRLATQLREEAQMATLAREERSIKTPILKFKPVNFSKMSYRESHSFRDPTSKPCQTLMDRYGANMGKVGARPATATSSTTQRKNKITMQEMFGKYYSQHYKMRDTCYFDLEKMLHTLRNQSRAT